MNKSSLSVALGLLAASGCADGPGAAVDHVKAEPGKDDSSAVASFLDFHFEGELVTDSSWRPAGQIEDQLLYTIGQLNEHNSVGRLDILKLSDIETEELGENSYRITYTATLPVAWGSRTNLPETFELRLPRDVSYAGKQAFTEAYSHDCVDRGAHDVDSGSFWYYYRPGRSGCSLEASDIVSTTATLTASDTQTTGKYPEYDKVWADGVLEVVAIFGKYEDDATSNGDAGISAYNQFVRTMKSELGGMQLETSPETIPYNPGVDIADITFTARTASGDQVVVTALLVDNIRTTSAAFDARYEELSKKADLIAYNGHAGLGSNVRALARKGRFVADQYVMVFMNGCDTFAYVDNALWKKMAELNPDDPKGTRHMDVITNAMPSYFRSMSKATTVLIQGLLSRDEPQTYEAMFRRIDSSQVILVSGEEDNAFVPGGAQPPQAWAGMDESGSVTRDEELRFETPALAPGSYEFDMTGTGDADLYVSQGQAPSTTRYECRPYRSGSSETCVIDIVTSTSVHVMVRGYEASSTFTVTGRRL